MDDILLCTGVGSGHYRYIYGIWIWHKCLMDAGPMGVMAECSGVNGEHYAATFQFILHLDAVAVGPVTKVEQVS